MGPGDGMKRPLPEPRRSILYGARFDWAGHLFAIFSGIVSIGDQIDVDIADLLDYFAMDHKTRAILLYIEAVKDARKFMSAARAASSRAAGLAGA